MSLTHRGEMMQKSLVLRDNPEVAQRIDVDIISVWNVGAGFYYPSTMDQDAESLFEDSATILPPLDDSEDERDLAPLAAPRALHICFQTANIKRYTNMGVGQWPRRNRSPRYSSISLRTTGVTRDIKKGCWWTGRNYSRHSSASPRTTCVNQRNIEILGLLAKAGSEQVRNSRLEARLPGLMVIDCFSRHVVVASPNCEYVALSYVWGSGGGGQKTFETDLRGRRLPQTIEDAMNVVRVLGMQFLWVDRYCINSSEPVTKHHMISNMDAVYADADLVIVAAAGADGEYGLPSVSRKMKMTRGARSIPPWDGVFWPSFTASEFMQMMTSTWSTRGWTCQEGLLCRRQLVFTETGVTHDLKTDRLQSVWTGDGIFSHINDYSQRTLTYPADSLKAFLGVFKAYERLQPPVMHVWGIPFRFVSEVQSGVMIDIKIKHPGYGLLWKTSGDRSLRPIPGLPSWTWAGWNGWSALSQRGPYDWLIQNAPPDAPWSPFWKASDIALEVMVGDQLRDIHEHLHPKRRLASGQIEDTAPVLYITAWSTSVVFHIDKAGVVRDFGRDVLNVNFTATDSLYTGELQPNGHWRCQLTAAVIWWGVRSVTSARTKQRPTQSLLLERVGPDTFRRIGVLETNWHKPHIITALGRTFTRTRLCIK